MGHLLVGFELLGTITLISRIFHSPCSLMSSYSMGVLVPSLLVNVPLTKPFSFVNLRLFMKIRSLFFKAWELSMNFLKSFKDDFFWYSVEV